MADYQVEKKAHIDNGGSLANGNRILAAMRAVFTAAKVAGVIDSSPMPDVKNFKEDKNQPIKYLNEEQLGRFLSALEARQESQRAERIRMIEHCATRKRNAPAELTGPFTDHLLPMSMLALHAGLRRGEVFNLMVSDFDFQESLVTVRGSKAKSGQSRQIPMNDTLLDVVTKWLNQTKPKTLVFPSPITGERFNDINKAFKKVMDDADLDFTFHNLRHTFGTKMAHARIDLVSIKELMGHDSLETTARYLHTNIDIKRSAVAVLS